MFALDGTKPQFGIFCLERTEDFMPTKEINKCNLNLADIYHTVQLIGMKFSAYTRHIRLCYASRQSPVSSVGRASDFSSEGQGFESLIGRNAF